MTTQYDVALANQRLQARQERRQMIFGGITSIANAWQSGQQMRQQKKMNDIKIQRQQQVLSFEKEYSDVSHGLFEQATSLTQQIGSSNLTGGVSQLANMNIGSVAGQKTQAQMELFKVVSRAYLVDSRAQQLGVPSDLGKQISAIGGGAISTQFDSIVAPIRGPMVEAYTQLKDGDVNGARQVIQGAAANTTGASSMIMQDLAGGDEQEFSSRLRVAMGQYFNADTQNKLYQQELETAASPDKVVTVGGQDIIQRGGRIDPQRRGVVSAAQMKDSNALGRQREQTSASYGLESQRAANARRLSGQNAAQARQLENLSAGNRTALETQKARNSAKGSGPKLTDTAGLRKEYTKLSAPFIQVRDSYERIKASSATPAGDISLIFNYMKMLDPGSVVRESEFATAENAAGVPERIRTQWNKLVDGDKLTPAKRQEFTNQARLLYSKQDKQQDKRTKEYGRIAEAAGIPRDQVTVDFKPPADSAAPAIPKTDDIVDGYRFKGGDPANPDNWELN